MRLIAGADPTAGLCEKEDMSLTVIFRSPGIRPDAGDLAEAQRRGALITSEMEWFCDATPADIFAVTGSDGKTTTTTLAHLFLREAGRRAYVGGNIGTPLLDRTLRMHAGDCAVLELSSFQLMTMRGRARRAAITNISPNHLNWHTDMAEYTEAKYRVFGEKTETLVLNAKNALSAAATERFCGHVSFFTAHNTPEDTFASLTGGRADCDLVFLRGDEIVRTDGQTEEVLLHRSEILLPGIHNVENYMTAMALTFGCVPPEVYGRVARTFRGVEHRFELVRELGGVRYYNSSIDSSPTRTAAALQNLNCPQVVICGGRDKNIPFDTLAKALFDRVKTVVLTGESAPKIAAALAQEAAGRPDGGKSLQVIRAETFEASVALAKEAASPGDAVILTPACTSFDRFVNFEERGKYFKKLVMEFTE